MALEEERYSPVPGVLTSSKKYRNHLVMGGDMAQVRFLGSFLGLPVQTVDQVRDDMFHGVTDALYHVLMPHQMDLSPEQKKRTGIWSAAPIVRGSEASFALVRAAASAMGLEDKKLGTPARRMLADAITKAPVTDIRAALATLMWMISKWGNRPAPDRFDPWLQPWEHPLDWFPKFEVTSEAELQDMVGSRLYSLYRLLSQYAVAKTFPDKITPAWCAMKEDFRAKLLDLSLDPAKVYESISLLARWKQQRTDPFVCALRVSAVWAN